MEQSTETPTEGSPEWWLTQDCGTLGDRLIRDMESIERNGSRTAEAYLDAAFAVFVPAVRTREEEIKRLTSELAEARRNAREAATMMHLLVKATGGQVTIPERLYVETVVGEQLQRSDDVATGDITYKVV